MKNLETLVRLLAEHCPDALTRALCKQELAKIDCRLKEIGMLDNEQDTDIPEITESELDEIHQVERGLNEITPSQQTILSEIEISRHTQLECPNCKAKSYLKSGRCAVCQEMVV